MSDTSCPAFPITSDHYIAHKGMTLRQYVAIAAMQGLCANPEFMEKEIAWISKSAWAQADSLLAGEAELAKGEGNE